MDVVNLKSEFETSKEIVKSCWKGYKTLDGKPVFDDKLWLSKENYEKRVEEFKKELPNELHIMTNKTGCLIVVNDLINKILLGVNLK